MKSRFFLSLCLALFTLAVSVRAQGQFDDVEIKATKVAGNVYMLKGAGGNIGVSVGEDGIFMIDDQFAELADKIKVKLSELNQGELKFILNTHHHGDHTGSNGIFGSEATVISHDNVRKHLSTRKTVDGEVVEPKPEELWPIMTFGSSLTLHFNGEEIKVIHAPGVHTDGDAVIHFTGSNVLHAGDLLFSGLFPYVDLASGGRVQSLIAYVEKLLNELPTDIKIIPGHGPLSDYSSLKTYHEMLIETTAFIREGMENGQSPDELKTRGVPDKWKDWSWSFIPTDRWIDIVYESYSTN